MSAECDERLWVRLRQYVDGAGSGSTSCTRSCSGLPPNWKSLGQAGYVLEAPVEADGLGLTRVAAAGEIR